jgi:hypothetical protein
VVLAVSANPVSATVFKQYIATTRKPATARASIDFFVMFLSFLVLSEVDRRERSTAQEVHLATIGISRRVLHLDPAFTPCLEAY